MSTIIGNPIMLGGGSSISAPIIGKNFDWTGGVGTYQVLDDGGGNWRIKFLSSGTFTPLKDMVIDAFLVGGGGAGYGGPSAGGAGGGGYTTTIKNIQLVARTDYQIIVGAGGTTVSSAQGNRGGETSAFTYSANGGYGGENFNGGKGGSGGGSYRKTSSSPFIPGNGGSDGGNGGGMTDYPGGVGQGTTTREFGEASGTLYSGGGGGRYSSSALGAGGGGGGADAGNSALANTGGGGGAGGAGGSGIVIIRKHKEAAA